MLKKKIEEQNQKIEDQGKKEEELNKKINQLEIKVMNLEEQNKKIKDELKEILKNEINKNRDNIRLVKTCNNLFPGAMIPCGNDTEMGGLFDRIINELKDKEEKKTHINTTPIVNSKSK